MPTLFIPARDQDAWATIRGFFYQADMTIERWLDLRDGQVLELERGEDIDTISCALGADDAEALRLLEQVKHRETSVTLRSDSARIALANAYAHFLENPGLDLVFRYTTNADAGVERPSAVPGGIAGLRAWEELRTGTWTLSGEAELLRALRVLLRHAPVPTGYDAEAWARYQEFVETGDHAELRGFIGRVEWSLGSPAATLLGPRIRERLVRAGAASNQEEAETLYHRLLVYALRLLSQRGLKRLTIQEREVQFALPTLPAEDRRLLARVAEALGALHGRVAALELTTERQEAVLTAVQRRVEDLTRSEDVDAAVQYVVATPVLDEPPPLPQRAERPNTVRALVNDAAGAVWVALHGPSGSGKTQLALLLAQAMTDRRIWLRFRDLTVNQCARRLDQAVKEVTGTAATAEVAKWMERFANQVGRGTFVVLDDLPRFAEADELGVRLVLLVRACALHGVRVLSTSPHPPPQAIEALLAQGALLSRTSPPFTDPEARALFIARGAPAEFTDNEQWVGMANALARRDPTLLQAMSRYLEEREWAYATDAFDGLLRNEYAQAVNEETVDRLLATTADAASRELLYRLNLTFGEFVLEDVEALAAAPPPIDRPRERLTRVLGLWVQRETGGRYAVAPRVRALGSVDLSRETAAFCHHALAARILNRRGLNQYEAAEAIAHLAAAGEVNRAGRLLVASLISIKEAPPQVDDGGLLSFWAEMPLPAGMDLPVRMHLRALQMVGRQQRGLDAAFALRDLDALVAVAPEGLEVAIFGSALVVVNALQGVDPRATSRYVRRMIDLWPAVEALLMENDGSPELPPHPGTLIWLAAHRIADRADLQGWLDLVEGLPEEIRGSAFSGSAAEQACGYVANRLVLLEANLPQQLRDWNGVLEAIRELQQRARALGVELLWASAVRAELTVLGDFQKELDAVVRTAEGALAAQPADPRAQFLIAQTAGLLLMGARDAEAIQWLELARKPDVTGYANERVGAHVSLGVMRARGDAPAAISILEEAVRLAEAAEYLPPATAIMAYGELAVAQWLANGLASAFPAVDRAAEKLLASKEAAEGWRDSFVAFGHVNGYFATLATSGRPPQSTGAGDEYVAPAPGIFLSQSAERAALYDEAKFPYIFAQIAMYADGIGADARALAWAERGMEIAKASGAYVTVAVLAPMVMTQLLVEDRYERALQVTLEAGRILSAASKARRAGSGLAETSVAAAPIMDGSPAPDSAAEGFAFSEGVVPLFLRVALVIRENPERGRELAGAAATILRQIAADAADHTLWERAA
jgi:energy-coupling factor transporter ATP-binding protein EcfA2